MNILQELFGDDGRFMPHGTCYLWQPELVGIHLVSDVLTGIAYFAIPPALVWFVLRARREAGPDERGALPYDWMFVAFGVFIIACGMTHFMGAVTIWHPLYWLSGSIKAVTALASIGTAIALPPLIPRALKLLREARRSEERRIQLEQANEELAVLYTQLKELDELRNRFFANVSHELRTPLTLILGPAERLIESERTDPETRRDLEVVRRNALTLLDNVNDLLDVARLDAGKLETRREPADLPAVVRTAAGLFQGLASDEDIDYRIDTPPPFTARIDADRIQRVIINLLGNAFKFAPAGGRVRCAVEHSEEQNEALIVVEDSGPGIPESERESIFERFSQAGSATVRMQAGTGLGLAIAREFVELHGGRIRVLDSPLGGARFEIRLPLAGAQDEAPASTPERSDTFDGDRIVAATRSFRAGDRSRAPDAGSGTAPGADAGPTAAGADTVPPADDRPRLLVAEDHADMRSFIVQTLGDEYDVEAAADGPRALELARARQPDLVLTDVMMPGMTGGDLIDRLQADPELATVPIIVLTAREDEELRVELLERGARDYVVKPFSAAELRARIGNQVQMARARAVLGQALASQEQDLARLAGQLDARTRELRRALDEAREARDEARAANQAKSNFLAVMSHELRTPLNAIMGYTELLSTGIGGRPVSPEQAERLDRIRRSAKHLLALIEQILTYARIESGRESAELVPTGVADLVHEALDLVDPLRPDAVSLDVDIQDAPTTLRTDPTKLRQVLTNLLSNALKFTDQGHVRLRAHTEGDEAVFVITDTGIGIDAENLDRIFDPFWQADQSATRTREGSGLGLTVARNLVELLDGSLEVESRPGTGTTFTVRIPAEADA